jgi:hypothetical protein
MGVVHYPEKSLFPTGPQREKESSDDNGIKTVLAIVSGMPFPKMGNRRMPQQPME